MRRGILFLFYFLVLTPVGLLYRMLQDPLRREFRPDAQSYLIRVRHH